MLYVLTIYNVCTYSELYTGTSTGLMLYSYTETTASRCGLIHLYLNILHPERAALFRRDKQRQTENCRYPFARPATCPAPAPRHASSPLVILALYSLAPTIQFIYPKSTLSLISTVELYVTPIYIEIHITTACVLESRDSKTPYI